MSKPTHQSPERSVLCFLPHDQRDALDELREMHCARGFEPQLETYRKARPELREVPESTAAVVLAASGRFAPRTILDAPFVRTPSGRAVPVGLLPITDRGALHRFAKRAAKVHRRAHEVPSFALLGQWLPRYLRIADKIQHLLRDVRPTVRWTEEAIGRENLVSALGSGLGLALYVGHGRSVGWCGYHGTRAHHFESFAGEPLGAVVSLCCKTASRWRTGLSYSESLPLLGVAAASFGAVTETLTTDNTRWAVRLCEVLRHGVQTIGELLVRAAPLDPGAARPYRLIGDPLAPLAAEAAGWDRAHSVKTYA